MRRVAIAALGLAGLLLVADTVSAASISTRVRILEHKVRKHDRQIRANSHAVQRQQKQLRAGLAKVDRLNRRVEQLEKRVEQLSHPKQDPRYSFP
ncbi:hypothetical protein [Sulfurivirga sp.]|uniref:hypothetical protein n=1 Tax=Sulfurivirga sp. TaxID=2614236 RepID=UPI0025D7FEE3|nr:hypothetical protein [Sulfurivirga sp.]